MMTQLSERQVAEVLTDLAKGHTAAKVATRRHLDEHVVLQMQDLYGPGQAALTKASREANRRLRDTKPIEDLEPVPAKAVQAIDLPAVDDPAPVVLVACDVDGCDWVLEGPTNTTAGAISQAWLDHQHRHLDDADTGPAAADPVQPGVQTLEVVQCAFCDHVEAGEGAWQKILDHENEVHRAADLAGLDVPHASEQQPAVGAAAGPVGNGPDAR